MYDVLVVGGGHAGCEACLAPARMGLKTALITGNKKMIASMPCNPSVGGPAKGIVVREIDALGGQMGKNADLTQIQMKMLNVSKGPAVRALRAQSDKIDYPRFMQETLEKQENLDIIEALVFDLIVEDETVKGVVLEDGTKILAQKVILTTGTYLQSRVLIGHDIFNQGPDNERTTTGLSNCLRQLGFTVQRLKTGTPPRIKTNTIDFSKTTVQPGDELLQYFSHDEKVSSVSGVSVPCYLTYTNKEIHQIIMDNLEKSAMYGGVVEGIGPRYCPSIEDKVVRFNDKERHQIFLEPESIHLDETYVQGFSTSMPKDVQEKMVHLLPGLENCIISKYAYAIEYDAIDPTELYPTLETKLVKNLYTAGQINGTSGYEEAACQGLMAGINAGLSLQNKEPLILKRHEGYIGLLIDDLVTKGTKEPYRLLTSRSEYRLLLRHDNADLRLRKYGYYAGLIDEQRYQKLLEKEGQITKLLNLFKEMKVKVTSDLNEKLVSINSTPLKDGCSLYELSKRPEIHFNHIKEFFNIDASDEVMQQVEIQIKYEGYIQKEIRQVEKIKLVEEKLIPSSINYDNVHNIALEAREKLKRIKPLTIGQASRISGVNPADIAVLLVYIETIK